MTRWIVAVAIGLLMLCEMLFNVPDLFAGAFDQLSPGNQKAAQALFEAQRSDLPPGTSLLTRDQIAERKLSGQGWGRIFDSMKSSGLVEAKNFGQVVSSFNHRHHLTSGGPVTTAADRTVSVPRDPSVRADPARAAQTNGRGQSALSTTSGQTHGRGHVATTTTAQAHAQAGGANGAVQGRAK